MLRMKKIDTYFNIQPGPGKDFPETQTSVKLKDEPDAIVETRRKGKSSNLLLNVGGRDKLNNRLKLKTS